MTATPLKPLVVLVPDLFGSHLRDAAGRVWVDDEALESGTTEETLEPVPIPLPATETVE